MEQALERLEARTKPNHIHELVTQAQDPPELTQQPGKFSILTPVLAALVVLCGAAGALGLAPKATLPLAVLLGFGAIYSFIDDLLLPSPRGRRTAREAAICFGKALKRSRWKNAYACLHRDSLPDVIQIPAMLQLNINSDQTSFSTLSGFSRYWKSFLRSKGSTIRVCRKVEIGQLESEGDYVVGRMFLTVERASQWTWLGLLLGMLPAVIIYKMTMKMICVRYKITMYRHKSQWWLLPPSLEDASYD